MKKNKKPAGIIYTVRHIDSGMLYVGATTSTLEKRVKDHIQKAEKGTGHYFQSAIATYTSEAFEWTQIDTANTIDELASKEQKYIQVFNSLENGFNSDRGGSILKSVYQYSMKTGKLLNKYPSLYNAANAVNANKTNISKACLGLQKSCKGFYWSYEAKMIHKPEDKRIKTVLQFSSSGKFLQAYKSVTEASKATKVYKSSIGKACRGERTHAGGYVWKYQDESKSNTGSYEV